MAGTLPASILPVTNHPEPAEEVSRGYRLRRVRPVLKSFGGPVNKPDEIGKKCRFYDVFVHRSALAGEKPGCKNQG